MNKLSIFLSTLIFSSIFLLVIYFHTHGLIPYDEGWFLQAGKRILDGERIYKDFEFLYNPGGAYLNAFAFKVFGESVFSSRILAIINSLISIFLVFYISKKIKLGGILSIILIFTYVFWGAGHINFIWPVMICLTLGLASGALILNKRFVLIGAISATTLLFKQNFGLAIILANATFFLINKNLQTRKQTTYFILGISIVGLIQILYFLHLGILDSYLRDLYFYTVVKIFKEGILNSPLPWDYPAHPIMQFLKFLFYTSPLSISLITIIKLLRNKNRLLLYFPIISIFFYILSIRPTTDFVHLTPLFAFSVINLGIVHQSLKITNHQRIFFILIILFCVLGAYSSFSRNYYRWNSPLIRQDIFSINSKVSIWTDEKESKNISEISNYFKNNDDRSLFIYDFSPIYYLVLDKKNPTSFDYLHTGVISKDDENRIINILKEKRVKNILTNTEINKNSSLIADFILKSYFVTENVNEYKIWELR